MGKVKGLKGIVTGSIVTPQKQLIIQLAGIILTSGRGIRVLSC
jgi:hypothetical protein